MQKLKQHAPDRIKTHLLAFEVWHHTKECHSCNMHHPSPAKTMGHTSSSSTPQLNVSLLSALEGSLQQQKRETCMQLRKGCISKHLCQTLTELDVAQYSGNPCG